MWTGTSTRPEKRTRVHKWKEVIETEIASLTKREFYDVLPKPSYVNPVGFKWIFHLEMK
jgi:hypothetical protein